MTIKIRFLLGKLIYYVKKNFGFQTKEERFIEASGDEILFKCEKLAQQYTASKGPDNDLLNIKDSLTELVQQQTGQNKTRYLDLKLFTDKDGKTTIYPRKH